MSPERGLLGDIPVTLRRLRLACMPGTETRQRAGTHMYIAFKCRCSARRCVETSGRESLASEAEAEVIEARPHSLLSKVKYCIVWRDSYKAYINNRERGPKRLNPNYQNYQSDRHTNIPIDK